MVTFNSVTNEISGLTNVKNGWTSKVCVQCSNLATTQQIELDLRQNRVDCTNSLDKITYYNIPTLFYDNRTSQSQIGGAVDMLLKQSFPNECPIT